LFFAQAVARVAPSVSGLTRTATRTLSRGAAAVGSSGAALAASGAAGAGAVSAGFAPSVILLSFGLTIMRRGGDSGATVPVALRQASLRPYTHVVRPVRPCPCEPGFCNEIEWRVLGDFFARPTAMDWLPAAISALLETLRRPSPKLLLGFNALGRRRLRCV